MFRTLFTDRIFKREAKLTLPDLDPPRVVTTNVYFWHPTFAEERILKEVYKWLEDLNLRLDLGLRLERGDYTIRVYKDDKQLAYFSYRESRRHVYKHQDFRNLLSYIEQKLAEKPLKTLSSDEERFYKVLSKNLLIPWDDPMAREVLIRKWDFFVSPLVSKLKFRNEDEIKEFLDTIAIEKLNIADLNDLLNYINIRNITSFKKFTFVIYREFRELFPVELLAELEKVIKEKNLYPEDVKTWFEEKGELKKHPEVYKIFVEFLKNLKGESDFEVWLDVLTYNPADLEFIKEVFGFDWSRLFDLLGVLYKEKDLRRRFHRAVKIRSRRVMEEVYNEVVGKKLVGEFKYKMDFEIISQFLKEKIFFVRMFIAGTPFEFAIGVRSDNALRELIRYANLVFDRFDIELDFSRDYRKIRNLYTNLVDGFVDYYGMAMVIENPQGATLTDKFFWIAPSYDIEPEFKEKIESIYKGMINKPLVDFIRALEREGLRAEFYYSRERSLAFAKDYMRLLVRRIKGLRTKAPKVAVVKLILDKIKREFFNERTGIS
ncbi:MAG: hypothetical protein QXU40_03875 [Candidatus Pacearchaeota archaeon]